MQGATRDAWQKLIRHSSMPFGLTFLASGDQRTASALEIPELAIKVFASLPVNDLLSAALVCRAWHMLCTDILYATQEVPFGAVNKWLTSFLPVCSPPLFVDRTDGWRDRARLTWYHLQGHVSLVIKSRYKHKCETLGIRTKDESSTAYGHFGTTDIPTGTL